jgi:hypothetical protein
MAADLTTIEIKEKCAAQRFDFEIVGQKDKERKTKQI